MQRTMRICRIPDAGLKLVAIRLFLQRGRHGRLADTGRRVAGYVFSPNGADPFQPRASSWVGVGVGPKPGRGDLFSRAAPLIGRPFRAGIPLAVQPGAALRSALGWYVTAPLGLNRYAADRKQ